MDDHARLQALLELAESVGLAVRYAARAEAASFEGSPGGALVKLRGREILFLDSAAALGDRIAVAAAALKGRPRIEEVFIPPEIRELIERGDPA